MAYQLDFSGVAGSIERLWLNGSVQPSFAFVTESQTIDTGGKVA